MRVFNILLHHSYLTHVNNQFNKYCILDSAMVTDKLISNTDDIIHSLFIYLIITVF